MKGRDEVFSTKIRAGKRTYFFDVRSTRSDDYYITITESKRRFDGRGYDKHKIFLYKEDFNKFLTSLNETIDHVKTELLPDYDYDEFTRREYDDDGVSTEAKTSTEETVVEAETEIETGTDTETESEPDTLSTSWEE